MNLFIVNMTNFIVTNSLENLTNKKHIIMKDLTMYFNLIFMVYRIGNIICNIAYMYKKKNATIGKKLIGRYYRYRKYV